MSGAIVALAMLVGCESSSSRIQALMGGSTGVEILKSATRVEAFRVGPPEKHSMDFNRWPVLSGPVVLDGAQSAEVGALLLEESAYGEWQSETGCAPMPGLKLVFSRNGAVRELLFCFECDELYVYDGARKVGSADFGPGRSRLLEAFIKLFPGEAVLRRLRRRY